MTNLNLTNMKKKKTHFTLNNHYHLLTEHCVLNIYNLFFQQTIIVLTKSKEQSKHIKGLLLHVILCTTLI